MVEVNDLIIEKLKKYPDQVQMLAISAIRLSETLAIVSVAEKLENEVRQIVRQQGQSK